MTTAKIKLPPKLVPVFAGKPLGSFRYRGAFGGRGCVHPETLLDTPSGQVMIKDFLGGPIYAVNGGKVVVALATKPKIYTKQQLYRVTLENGNSIRVTDEHRFLTQSGWMMLKQLHAGDAIFYAPLRKSCACHLQTNSVPCPPELPSDVRHLTGKLSSYQVSYSVYSRQCGQQLQSAIDIFPAFPPLQDDAQLHKRRVSTHEDGSEFLSSNSPLLLLHRLSNCISPHEQGGKSYASLENYIVDGISARLSGLFQSHPLFLENNSLERSALKSCLHEPYPCTQKNLGESQQTVSQHQPYGALDNPYFLLSCNHDLPILSKVVEIATDDFIEYWDVHVPVLENYLSNGIINHNSGKSFNFALMAAVFGYAEPIRVLCTREFQSSIRESFHAELKNAINSHEWLAENYDVGAEYIRGKNGTEFIFRGLRNTIGSIKSTALIDVTIVEEAEDVPEDSWLALEATVFRKPNSELWPIWNPKVQGSPVDKRFRQSPPDSAAIVELNWNDNPYFPDALNELRERQLRILDHGTYSWVWEGSYLTKSDAQILNGKYEIADFTPQSDWNGPYYGADWGFSQDPTTLIKCWIHADKLYIEHELYRTGLEITDTPAAFETVPDAKRHTIRADSARPETISHMRRSGFDVVAAHKGKGSVEDGIAHLRGYEKIIIHPRCKHTADEARLYSYKTDRLTGDVLTDIIDAHNHCIDALRYALEPLSRRNIAGFGFL